MKLQRETLEKLVDTIKSSHADEEELVDIILQDEVFAYASRDEALNFLINLLFRILETQQREN